MRTLLFLLLLCTAAAVAIGSPIMTVTTPAPVVIVASTPIVAPRVNVTIAPVVPPAHANTTIPLNSTSQCPVANSTVPLFGIAAISLELRQIACTAQLAASQIDAVATPACPACVCPAVVVCNAPLSGHAAPTVPVAVAVTPVAARGGND